jgi:hypothetical protein
MAASQSSAGRANGPRSALYSTFAACVTVTVVPHLLSRYFQILAPFLRYNNNESVPFYFLASHSPFPPSCAASNRSPSSFFFATGMYSDDTFVPT